MKHILIFVFLASAAMAQTTLPVTITWTDALNPANVNWNVYKAQGSAALDCAGPLVYAKLSGPTTTKSYVDNLSTSVTAPVAFCYAITAVMGKFESAKSTPAVYILLATPTNVSAQ